MHRSAKNHLDHGSFFWAPDRLRWLVKDYVECVDGSHTACNELRTYLQYAPIVCNGDKFDPYNAYSSYCRLTYELVFDGSLIEALAKDHQATPCEAKECIALLSKVIGQ